MEDSINFLALTINSISSEEWFHHNLVTIWADYNLIFTNNNHNLCNLEIKWELIITLWCNNSYPNNKDFNNKINKDKTNHFLAPNHKIKTQVILHQLKPTLLLEINLFSVFKINLIIASESGVMKDLKINKKLKKLKIKRKSKILLNNKNLVLNIIYYIKIIN